MANEVYTVEEILLRDGTEVELRPLPIAKLRKFMRMWSEHIADVSKRLSEQPDDEAFNEADLSDEQYDILIKMCALGLETELRGEKTTKQFIEYLENTLDEPTVHKILYVTGGLKLSNDDPNPQAQPSPLEAGTI